MTTIDDKASEAEERHRQASLEYRSPESLEHTGYCHYCNEKLVYKEGLFCLDSPDMSCRDEYYAEAKQLTQLHGFHTRLRGRLHGTPKK